MTHPTTSTPANVRRDRAVGAVVASAAGDALGAPFEFGPALAATNVLAMTGGGSFGWAKGEWTDDTQTALAALVPLSQGLQGSELVEAIGKGLTAWFASDPADVGIQTRAVLGAARRAGTSVAAASAEYTERNPESSGNGSLMRTGPLALAGGDRRALADLAARVSALTHASRDTTEACVLWTDAIRRMIDLEGPTDGTIDWVGIVATGLELVDEERRALWAERLEACRSTPPGRFTPNGYVVTALQAALSALAQTPVPTGQPCLHLRLAIERAIRIGSDTDTVAAICGALAGAYWGATAVPLAWRRPLHGRFTYDLAALSGAELEALARRADNGGADDPIGWPTIDSLLPYYAAKFPSAPLAAPLDEYVTVGNVAALAEQRTKVDVVVSLCRMGSADVPGPVEHHVVGLLDTTAADNPNLDFVLADTAEFVATCAAEGKRVFLHCVQAQNRTPAVAAAYLMRTKGIDARAALAEAERATGTRPHSFLAAALERLTPR